MQRVGPDRIKLEFFSTGILRTCVPLDNNDNGNDNNNTNNLSQNEVRLESLLLTDDAEECDPRIGVEPRPNDINAQILIGITVGGFAFITVVFVLIVGVIRCALSFENPYLVRHVTTKI